MNKRAGAIQSLFQTVSLGAPENAVGFVLWRIVARYQREMDQALGDLGLTHLQFMILALVAWFGRAGQAGTQVELARFGGIHPMQVSQTLKTLESKHLVLRRQSRSDSRAKQVSVTQTGLTALRHGLPRGIAVQARLFGIEGRPGGAFLQDLLRLEERMSKTEESGLLQDQTLLSR